VGGGVEGVLVLHPRGPSAGGSASRALICLSPPGPRSPETQAEIRTLGRVRDPSDHETTSINQFARRQRDRPAGGGGHGPREGPRSGCRGLQGGPDRKGSVVRALITHRSVGELSFFFFLHHFLDLTKLFLYKNSKGSAAIVAPPPPLWLRSSIVMQ